MKTRYFGEMDYAEDAVIRIPAGIPGFPGDSGYLLIQFPTQYPLVYLQSLQRTDVCFAALPVRVASPGYELTLSEEDARALGVGTRPKIGDEVLCLAFLAAEESGIPTANLKAPVVIRIQTRMAAQCLNGDGNYLCRHPLEEVVTA